MEHGGPSRTAWGAAGHRGAHQVLEDGRIFRDPLALRILGDDADRVVEDARASPRRTLMRIFIAVRHRVAEDALARHVAAGTLQVVVLGAGLDTFAYRNPFSDSGVRVFEVDHPATQEWKRDTLARAGIPIPQSVVYAPVDFEADDLATRLAASGVDLAAPTFFLWLGVVPYLTRAAVDATLQVVVAVPGAGVAFDYPNPVDQLSDRSRAAHQARADRMRQLGEPWITYFDTDDSPTTSPESVCASRRTSAPTRSACGGSVGHPTPHRAAAATSSWPPRARFPRRSSGPAELALRRRSRPRLRRGRCP